MLKKAKKIIEKGSEKLYVLSEWFEHVMAVVVLVAIVIAIISLWTPFTQFVEERQNSEALLTFLGYVFNVVIGIEFFKLLCRPGADTVMEVLMFVIARHMIIQETSVMDNLWSVIGIAVLFAVKKFLLSDGKHVHSALDFRKKTEDEMEQVEADQKQK